MQVAEWDGTLASGQTPKGRQLYAMYEARFGKSAGGGDVESPPPLVVREWSVDTTTHEVNVSVFEWPAGARSPGEAYAEFPAVFALFTRLVHVVDADTNELVFRNF